MTEQDFAPVDTPGTIIPGIGNENISQTYVGYAQQVHDSGPALVRVCKGWDEPAPLKRLSSALEDDAW